MNKNKVCTFTGHRKLSKINIESLIKKLNYEIEKQIENGVTTYISGGALGYDQICASLIISKKELNNNIKLIFVLPCKNQDKLWNDKQKELYKNLLLEADEVIYITDNYTDSCMKLRNKKLIEMSDVCICALENKYSGTYQTVKMANEKGIEVINVLENSIL